MKYVIVISSVGNSDESSTVVIYQQVVEDLDVKTVINAVNSSLTSSPVPAREPRKRAKRSDAGKPRRKENVTLVP
jgi:hypothetical protein